MLGVSLDVVSFLPLPLSSPYSHRRSRHSPSSLLSVPARSPSFTHTATSRRGPSTASGVRASIPRGRRNTARPPVGRLITRIRVSMSARLCTCTCLRCVVRYDPHGCAVNREKRRNFASRLTFRLCGSRQHDCHLWRQRRGDEPADLGRRCGVHDHCDLEHLAREP